MALLLREQLKAAMAAGDIAERLIVTPLLDPKQIGPGSIDLRLGTEFIEVERHTEAVIDPYRQQDEPPPSSGVTRFVPLGDRIALHPGQFILGATLEFLRLPGSLGAQVLSRSSWGRLGLLVATAVAVQPGFAGCLTLELVNAGSVPIQLRPGLRVAQLQVWSGESVSENYSSGGGKYQAPLGPESNKLAWERGELERLQLIGKHLLGRQ